MKTGVVYATKTGHSKKIALAVAKQLQVEAMDIKNKPKLEDLDYLFIVGGIYGGKGAPELQAYVEGIRADQVKKVALLTLSASKKAELSDVRKTLSGKGITVIADDFKCPGSFLFMRMGHPNENDQRDAVEFVKKIISLP